MGKIQESNEKLNGDIDAAVMDMMLYLKQKMEANQDFLESELARRKQECDETVQALRNRADDVIADLDKALDNTNIRIQQAIKDNDKDLQSKLSLLQSSIGDAYDCVDAAEANLKKWENAIKQFEATGMYDQIGAGRKDASINRFHSGQERTCYPGGQLPGKNFTGTGGGAPRGWG